MCVCATEPVCGPVLPDRGIAVSEQGVSLSSFDDVYVLQPFFHEPVCCCARTPTWTAVVARACSLVAGELAICSIAHRTPSVYL